MTKHSYLFVCENIKCHRTFIVNKNTYLMWVNGHSLYCPSCQTEKTHCISTDG